MSMLHHFDTHLFATKLRNAGFEGDQVDTLIELAVESTPKDLVTKTDLTTQLTLSENRMTIRVASIVVATVGFFTLFSDFLS